MSQIPTPRSLQLSRAGFTLTEMLVAVGALALLALGVAQVFSLTTRTVAAGRRLSALNAIASATERQMRADVGAMTSRGVLIIRNEIANGGAAVDAYPADPEGRVRRIDELEFAAVGQFTSMQQPVTADGKPVSSPEAMIYYGHGARQDPNTGGNSGFTTPVAIDDSNASAPALGVNTGPGGSKVNRYASEWTLVRRAFVMAPPSTVTQRIIPAGQGFSMTSTYDTAREIAGLPAVPSPNRTDAAAWNSYSAPTATLRGNTWPALSSGVVDVVAMDLRTVAAQVADLNTTGFNNFGDPFALNPRSYQMPVGTGSGQQGGATMWKQQAWFRTLLPADSDSGRRIRVETSAPDFMNFNGGASTPVRRADQLMLSTGAFLPRCSEFIVEYSFGKARTNNAANSGPPADVGAVYWHGLGRQTGVIASGNDYGRNVYRYRDWVQANNASEPLSQNVVWRDRSTLPNSVPANAVGRKVYLYPDLVEPDVIGQWGSNSQWNSSANCSYALFGINDPLYAPQKNLLAKDVNGNGQYDWADGDVLQEPESVPWMRPTMLRITFTLCDPTDPSIEQTFQFILDIPKDQRGTTM